MLATLAAVAVTAAGLSGLVIWQHTYDLREQAVTVRRDGRTLQGVLALPERGKGPFPLVVVVHGDGPVDATHDTFYRPIWESFARAGYAALSWNKPGVGGAPGNWLDQSMGDRAAEALDAIAWARQRPDIDGDRIGLWGASQAGWVLPRIAAQDPGIRFAIAVSPAVNWLRQGRYHLLAELRRDGASDAEVAAALRRRETGLELLGRGASYEEYVRAVGDPQGMTAAHGGSPPGTTRPTPPPTCPPCAASPSCSPSPDTTRTWTPPRPRPPTAGCCPGPRCVSPTTRTPPTAWSNTTSRTPRSGSP
ncbi:alpha/beta hydrolase family protein [Streptomyces parvus]